MSRKIIINKIITFEPEKKTIAGGKVAVTISASATYCLQLLIDKVGELVSHEQLYDYAWRQFGMEPTATSLYQNISNIRRAIKKAGLKDDIIRTMPRRGFILSPLSEIVRCTADTDHTVVGAPPEVVMPLAEEITFADNQVEETSSRPEAILSVGTNSTEKFRPKWLVAALMLALIYVLYLSEGKYSYYFSDMKGVSGCQILINRDIGLNPIKTEKSVAEPGLRCEENQYIYLSNYKHPDMFLVISCDKELDSESDPGCHSSYYFRDIYDE